MGAWILSLHTKDRWLGSWALWRIWSAILSDSICGIGDWILATGRYMSKGRNLTGSAWCSALTHLSVLEGMGWRPFSGIGQGIFSLVGAKPEGKKWEEKEEEEKVAEHVMVSTISFIQANLQNSIAAPRVLTRTVVVKGIDMAIIQELWY